MDLICCFLFVGLFNDLFVMFAYLFVVDLTCFLFLGLFVCVEIVSLVVI